MRLFFEFKFSENITNFKLGKKLTFECEFNEVFNTDKYDSVNLFKCDVSSYFGKRDDVQMSGYGNKIKDMILLPDFIPIKKWFNIKFASTAWCSCTTETHTYNVCIGQIDLSNVNSCDVLELVVWKNKSDIQTQECFPSVCMCDYKYLNLRHIMFVLD
eukprot:70057_1